MGYFSILTTSGGLAVAEVFALEPALHAEDSFFFEADILEVGSVGLITGWVFLQAHWLINLLAIFSDN
jgi:hypothetical protein